MLPSPNSGGMVPMLCAEGGPLSEKSIGDGVPLGQELQKLVPWIVNCAESMVKGNSTLFGGT